MANPIKPKSTTTASKVPGSGDLLTGELACNLADGVLFLKKSDGTIVTFNTGGVSSVSGTGTVSGLTLTGTVTSSGNLTLGGSLKVDGYGLPFNGITSGIITLQAVAAAGTNTITLPAITGNLITDADSGTVINKMLDNDSVTVTAGTGLSGGGAVALGGTITLDNDGVTAAAVSGTGLSISGSTGSVTITSNATDANTASTIVARDASGNFSAGTITASLSGNATNVTGTVAIANGGTGATDAATARSNLGLAIGTDVQAYDADLGAISAISGTSGLLKKTAANTWTLDQTAYGLGSVTSVSMTVPTGLKISGSPITSTGTLALSMDTGYAIPTSASQTNWDSAYTQRLQWDGGSTNLVAATARTSLGLVIGTNVQAWDADLDAIAAIAGTSGLLKKTAANTWSLDTSTYLTANQSITLSGDVTGSGSTAITTTLATVSIAKGGTGQTTQQAAINALTGTQSSGKYLRSDGTNATLSSIQAADVPTLNQNTTGSSASCTGNAATATSLASGGAGQIPYQSSANTSAFLSAGTSGQVLRSNGTNAPSWEVQGLFHGGRLTLTSGTPVTTSDVTAATTIYYTPFMGDKISLSDGTNWATYTFTERSLLLSGLTANRNYDVYLYNNAGTLTLEALVWNSLSDSNTRTTGLVLTSGGIYTKSGDATRRYLGTFRTTGTTGQTEDSTSKRFVWNYSNRVERMLLKQYVSSTWTNNVSNTYRYLGNNSANSVSIVNGIQEDNIFLVAASVSSASGIQRQLAIGFNSEWSGTSVGNSTSQYSATAVQAETNNESYNAFANRIPGLGYQVAYAIELQNSTTTVTYYGGVESGISGIWRC